MKRLRMDLPRYFNEVRDFRINKCDDIKLPDGLAVCEIIDVLDFLEEAEENLYQKDNVVYSLPAKETTKILCCIDFWDKHKEAAKKQEKAQQQPQQEGVI